MVGFYTFLRHTFSNFDTTGAIAPSSRTLAKSITSLVARKKGPVKILEVGAGTGVLTRRLLKLLQNDDHLDICEINPNFIKYLQKRFREDDSFKGFVGSVAILPIDIQKLEGENLYDYIISSLPLNAFEPQMVKNILQVYMRILKPWGWISYFEYIGIRTVKTILANEQEKQRLGQVTEVVKSFIQDNEVFKSRIWWNLPPAYVRHCQKNAYQNHDS